MGQRGSKVVLFSSLFIIMLGFGIIIPVLPFYTQSLGATSLHLGLLMASYSLMQLMFAPIWGNLSDRIGRKPILLIGLGGFYVSFFLFGMANALWVLFVARIMGGILSSAAMPVVMAMISDTTGEGDRARGMGQVGAAMGLGMVFGPALGGLLFKYGIHTPFFVAAAMALVTVLYAALFLKETLNKGRVQEPRKFPSIVDSLKGSLAGLMVLAFTVSLANAGLETILAYYAKDTFGFGARELGYCFTVMGIVSVALQGFLIGRIVQLFGEYRIIVMGLVITASAFLLLIEATGLITLTLYLALSGIGMGLVRPGITTLISRKAVAGQGETMGTMSSFDSLGRIVGPVLGGELYLFHPTYPFLVGALILILVATLSLRKLKNLAAQVGEPTVQK